MRPLYKLIFFFFPEARLWVAHSDKEGPYLRLVYHPSLAFRETLQTYPQDPRGSYQYPRAATDTGRTDLAPSTPVLQHPS